jgi:hypothetical protein
MKLRGILSTEYEVEAKRRNEERRGALNKQEDLVQAAKQHYVPRAVL